MSPSETPPSDRRSPAAGPSSDPARAVDDALTHVDASGAPRMVDVSAKPETARRALACATVHLHPQTLARVREGTVEKGAVLEVARIAGIMAAKRTPDLIPLCHPIRVSAVRVDVVPVGEDRIEIEAEVTAGDRTGVEMEALVAATTAALTVYDMLKAVEKGITISGVRLLEKDGGKSGPWRAEGRGAP